MRLNPQPGERILDLATGTGWTSRVVARRGATVIGADIASDLLDAARARAAEERLPIEYQLADAESLPFEDGAFDAVVSTCGIMFASRPEAAAARARPGLPQGRPDRAHDLAVGRQPLQDVRGHEKATCLRRRARPRRSPFEWGRTERIRELLGSAFQLRFEQGISYYREPSGEAAWETFSTGYGPTRSLAASLDPERREALHQDFAAFHAGFPTELGICVPRQYWLTIGQRV